MFGEWGSGWYSLFGFGRVGVGNSLCEVLALSSGKHVDIARSAQKRSGNIILEVRRWLAVKEVGGEVLVCEVRGRTPQITGTPNWIRLH